MSLSIPGIQNNIDRFSQNRSHEGRLRSQSHLSTKRLVFFFNQPLVSEISSQILSKTAVLKEFLSKEARLPLSLLE